MIATIASQPAASIAFFGVLLTVIVGTIANFLLNRSRQDHERDLAGQRFDFDILLAERKFNLDRDLAVLRSSEERALDDWKRRSEFAEQVLADFYDIRARIRAVRSPLAWGSENDDRQGRDAEGEGLRGLRDTYYPISRRLNDNAAAINAFYARRYRAIALFGADAEIPFVTIWNAIHRISTAAAQLQQQHLHGDLPNLQALRTRLEEAIWEGLAEEDAIAIAIDGAVAGAEHLFSPMIVGRPVAAQAPTTV